MSTRRADRRILLCTTVLGAALLAGSAAAQDTATLEEITVTAQKRAQDVLDVGGTLEVVSAAELASRRVEQVKDLTNLTPNLDIKEQVPGAMPVITIRGVGLDDFSSTNNPSAGIYIDEVYLASLAQMSFDLFDVERVEVLKGPQGTLYGRNSTAGALNIVTAKPAFDGFAARAAAGYGNFETYDLEGMVNIPLSETFAIRLAAKTIQQDEGFWFNRTVNRDIGRRDVWLGRVQLRWAPTEDLDVNLKVDGQKARSEMGQGAFFGIFPSPANPAGVGCPGDPRCTDFLGYRDPDGDPFKGDWAADSHYDFDQVATTLKIDWTLPIGTLTSVTGYANFSRDFYIDVDSTPNRVTDFVQIDKINQLSQELRLAGSTPTVQWLVGGFLSSDHVRTANPGFLEALFNTRLLSSADQETDSAAAFGHAEWALRDNLTLVTGLRYTWEEKSDVGGTLDLVPNCPASFLTMAPCGTPPIQLARVNATIEDTNWSWKVGLNFKPDPLTLLYVTASQGVKSGGFFSGVTTSDAQLIPYKPERLISVEAGWKRRMPEAGLSLAASAFYYDYHDVQTFIRDTSGALPIQRLGNVDKAELYGADVDLTWRPPAVEGLTFQAGLGLLHTKLGGFIASAGPIASGNKLPNAPEMTFNSSAEYAREVAAGWTLKLQAAARYSSSAFKEALNDPIIRQAAYWTFDGRVALASDAWEVAVWGKNLSDELYVVQGLNNAALGYGNRYYSAPRTYGVSLSRRW